MREEDNSRKTIPTGFKIYIWILCICALFSLFSLLIYNGYISQLLSESKSFLTSDKEAVLLPEVAINNDQATGGGIEIALSEPVEKDYFNDALFVGDSITSGFTIYDMFYGFNAIYKVGVNPMTATTTAFTTTSTGRELTMTEAVRYYNPRKLYIMLGTNGINWASSEELLSGYKDLIVLLKNENPDCAIIVQSIPPVSKWVALERPSFTKESFDTYNAGLKKLSMEMGIYFLDINAAFTTEDGYLSSDYAAPDGIHFGYGGYQRWYDYLMCHTVHGSSVYHFDNDGYLDCDI
jgi:lysophospholipase L1-like esterase